MFKNQYGVMVGLLILLAIGFIHYRFYPSHAFFDDGKAVAVVEQQDFFNYGIDKKRLRKNHAV